MVQGEAKRFIELRYGAVVIVVLEPFEAPVEMLLRSVIVIERHVDLLLE